MNTNPKNQPPVHHLNIADMKRIMAEIHSIAVPLHCHEDECFVEGSELSAQPAETSMEPSITGPHSNQKAS